MATAILHNSELHKTVQSPKTLQIDGNKSPSSVFSPSQSQVTQSGAPNFDGMPQNSCYNYPPQMGFGSQNIFQNLTPDPPAESGSIMDLNNGHFRPILPTISEVLQIRNPFEENIRPRRGELPILQTPPFVANTGNPNCDGIQRRPLDLPQNVRFPYPDTAHHAVIEYNKRNGFFPAQQYMMPYSNIPCGFQQPVLGMQYHSMMQAQMLQRQSYMPPSTAPANPQNAKSGKTGGKRKNARNAQEVPAKQTRKTEYFPPGPDAPINEMVRPSTSTTPGHCGMVPNGYMHCPSLPVNGQTSSNPSPQMMMQGMPHPSTYENGNIPQIPQRMVGCGSEMMQHPNGQIGMPKQMMEIGNGMPANQNFGPQPGMMNDFNRNAGQTRSPHQQPIPNPSTPFPMMNGTASHMNGAASEPSTSPAFMQNGPRSCAVCQLEIIPDQDVQCLGHPLSCQRHFHFNCVGLSLVSHRALQATEYARWICDECARRFVPHLASR